MRQSKVTCFNFFRSQGYSFLSVTLIASQITAVKDDHIFGTFGTKQGFEKEVSYIEMKICHKYTYIYTFRVGGIIIRDGNRGYSPDDRWKGVGKGHCSSYH